MPGAAFTSNLKESESNAEENKNADNEVGNEENAHESNNTKSEAKVPYQLFGYYLQKRKPSETAKKHIIYTLFASHWTYMNV